MPTAVASPVPTPPPTVNEQNNQNGGDENTTVIMPTGGPCCTAAPTCEGDEEESDEPCADGEAGCVERTLCCAAVFCRAPEPPATIVGGSDCDLLGILLITAVVALVLITLTLICILGMVYRRQERAQHPGARSTMKLLKAHVHGYEPLREL